MPSRRSIPPAAPLDLAGLDGPVSLGEVSAYYRRADIPRGRRWWTIAVVIAIYLTGQAVFLRILLPATGLDSALLDAVYGGFLVFTGLYALLLSAVIWRNASRPVRIARTAQANDLRYSERGPTGLRLPGSVPNDASAVLMTTDVVTRAASDAAGPAFTAATLTPPVAGTRRRHGIAAITLERETPHIVLVNRRAGVLRETGRRFRGQQRLRLEGDFDRTFTLFCPRGYETDALYIFTPDLMALMLDLASDCEAELLDGHLVLYSGTPWRLWTARGFTRLITLVDLVGRKTRSRTELYQDDRSPAAATVAAGGRRLRVRPSWGAIVSTVVPAVFIGIGFVSLITGAL